MLLLAELMLTLWLFCGLFPLVLLAERVFAGIESSACLFLSCGREIADTLEISDDSCHVVHVLAMAVWAFLEVALVDVSAVVADGVGDVECEIVATFFCGNTQQLAILLL